MNKKFTRGGLRAASAIGASALLLSSLVACSSDSGNTSPDSATAEEIEAVLQEGTNVTWWTWAPSAEKVVEAFTAKYPNMTVNLVNAGSSQTEYTKLQNAIRAGSGIPDVATIEYFALPQFALTESLQDLTSFGFDEYADTYTASTWSAVNINDGIYGLPHDSGPMALFYNQEVFDTYGLEVPETWGEYVEAARKLHAANPNAYITNDTGDASFTNAMLWQAGSQPFKVENTSTVTVDLADEGAQKYTEVWNQLIEEDLLAPIPLWSNEWYQALSDGSIASVAIGAWMPGRLLSGVPDGAGKWRVAPLPVYEAGDTASSEFGGSSQVMLSGSTNKLAAAGLLKFLAEEGPQILFDAGGFPAKKEILESDQFLNQAPEYFGGQEIGKIFAESSENVLPGWSFLPYQVYANGIFSDTAGKSYANRSDLLDGLGAWQDGIVEYGESQGFTVNTN